MREEAKEVLESLDRLAKYHEVTAASSELVDLWFLDLPFPAWFKTYDEETNSFRMTLLTPRYEAQFGITLEDYLGQEDAAGAGGPWQQEAGDAYRTHDHQVLSEGREVLAVEGFTNPSSGLEERWVICKFPVWKNGVCIGVGGIILFTHRVLQTLEMMPGDVG